MKGHAEVVRLLLEAKAEVDSKDSFGKTPLSWAAHNGHVEVVKLLEKWRRSGITDNANEDQT